MSQEQIKKNALNITTGLYLQSTTRFNSTKNNASIQNLNSKTDNIIKKQEQSKEISSKSIQSKFSVGKISDLGQGPYFQGLDFNNTKSIQRKLIQKDSNKTQVDSNATKNVQKVAQKHFQRRTSNKTVQLQQKARPTLLKTQASNQNQIINSPTKQNISQPSSVQQTISRTSGYVYQPPQKRQPTNTINTEMSLQLNLNQNLFTIQAKGSQQRINSQRSIHERQNSARDNPPTEVEKPKFIGRKPLTKEELANKVKQEGKQPVKILKQQSTTVVVNKAALSSPYRNIKILNQQVIKKQQEKLQEKQEIIPVKTGQYSYQPYKRNNVTLNSLNLNKQQQKQQNILSNSTQINLIQKAVSPYQNKLTKPVQMSSQKQKQTKKPLPANLVKQQVPQQIPRNSIQNKSSPYHLVKNIKIEQKFEQTKKPQIPTIAYNFLNILYRKRQKKLIKYSFGKIISNLKQNQNKEKYARILSRSTFNIAQSYQKFIKFNVMKSLKKLNLSILQNTKTDKNILNNNLKAMVDKNVSKSKQIQNNLQSLKQSMKRPLAIAIHNLFIQKIKTIFKQNLIEKSFSFKPRKTCIFSNLSKLFIRKKRQQLKQSFKIIKFNHFYCYKRNNENLLALYESKNKKINNQQIIKFLQRLFISSQPDLNASSRLSLLSNTSQKSAKQTPLPYHNPIKIVQISKSPNKKLINIQKQIEILQKQLQQQKTKHQKQQSQIKIKQTNIKQEINKFKKENDEQKKQYQLLKDELNKIIVLDDEDGAALEEININNVEQEAENNLVLQVDEQDLQLSKSCIQILSDIYVKMYKNQFINDQNLTLSIQDFLNQFSRQNNLLKSAYSYLKSQTHNQNIHQSKRKFFESMKNLIEENQLINQNAYLRRMVEIEEKKFMKEQQLRPDENDQKINQEVKYLRRLTKNYLNQRYLWNWVRKQFTPA